MKERPIMCNDDMVRAILDGRKTQSRRTKGLDKINQNPGEYSYGGTNSFGQHIFNPIGNDDDCLLIKCPYGVPGDRLWVRETWQCFVVGSMDIYPIEPGIQPGISGLGYRATDNQRAEIFNSPKFLGPWRPSTHMPRWASRIILEVVDIRAERVRDISDVDAKAEGASCVLGFANSWDSIKAKRCYGWEVNPWVFIIVLDTFVRPADHTRRAWGQQCIPMPMK